MAEPARNTPLPEAPPVDPEAVRRAYLRERARRRARVQHSRELRRAGIRFWTCLLLLLAASIALAVTFWREVQQLFGL